MAKILGTKMGMDGATRVRPRVEFTETDLPEIKKWEVGKKYDLNLRVEMVFMSKGDEYGWNPSGQKKPMRAKFEILEVSEEKENESFGKEYARKRAAGAAQKGY